jgi:uncharacterized membrane protein (UPF0127 family)
MNFKLPVPARVFGFYLLLFFVFGACAAQSSDKRADTNGKAQTGLETKTITIVSQKGPVPVDAELARTDTERSAGLMFRTGLEDGKGMLFIFDKDEVLSFWMKNTLIPLSIAYIAYDGTIIDIRDMYPNDTSPVHSSRSVRYALEVPQGWFKRAGVKEGDTVKL